MPTTRGGFDIPREQIEAGFEAYEDRMIARLEIEGLIASLRAADGANFALEQSIMWVARKIPAHQRSVYDRPPAYTASIDAALLLVPKGYRWTVGCGRLVQYVATLEPVHDASGVLVGECDSAPAIALCIAALQTISATE